MQIAFDGARAEQQLSWTLENIGDYIGVKAYVPPVENGRCPGLATVLCMQEHLCPKTRASSFAPLKPLMLSPKTFEEAIQDENKNWYKYDESFGRAAEAASAAECAKRSVSALPCARSAEAASAARGRMHALMKVAQTVSLCLGTDCLP